jgi:hypothetical protein
MLVADKKKEDKEKTSVFAEKLNAALEAAEEVVSDLNEALKAKNGQTIIPELPPSACPAQGISK